MPERISIDTIYAPNRSVGSVTFINDAKEKVVLYQCDPEAARCIYLALMAMKEKGVNPLLCDVYLTVTNA